MARRLGRKGTVPIVTIVGVAVVVVAAMANVGVGVLFLAKHFVYPIPHPSEQISEAHGRQVRNELSLWVLKGGRGRCWADCGEAEEGLLSREL
jgi:hypothetical protein